MNRQTPPAWRRPLALAALVSLAALLTFVTPHPTAAAEEPAPAARDGAAEDNAALPYWLAFALMPPAQEQQQIIDAWAPEHGALDAPGHVSADPKVVELLERSKAGFSLLRRGARMSRCSWGLDYGEGPELLMPHLAKAKQLATLAGLRGRHHFMQGKPREGVVDALCVMKLGHDVGSDPILIAILVQYGIEDLGTQLLARHLPTLSPEELDQLEQTLGKLPSGGRLKEVWATESKFMVDWFEERLPKAEAGGDWSERVLAMPIFGEAERAKLKAAGVPAPAEMRKQLEAMRAYYRALEPLTDLPPAEQQAKLAALPDVRRDSVLAQILLPAVGRALKVHNRAKVQSALLRAAIAAQRGGPERLKEPAHADPVGGGPFAYRKTEGGFALSSKLKVDAGKAVTLTVGQPAR